MLSINENVKHYHEDFNGGTAMTGNVPSDVTNNSSEIIPDELKSLYGSITSDWLLTIYT